MGICWTCRNYGVKPDNFTFHSVAALNRWVDNHYQWHLDNPQLGEGP